ncbi:hypothetical protein BJ138DRAFT_1168322 [Hygrophoropsis aurantiaca]|uniref:Uncharacterized protein n=1 Tax=Hygrophoropsis aurantiaca TaxID=72124 RepID=A0ACB7ZRJ4_9AGAM|nr:hypothetical protein BJ138DRAFT_1168322 [Hygrophoropsis aurantiaca]
MSPNNRDSQSSNHTILTMDTPSRCSSHSSHYSPQISTATDTFLHKTQADELSDFEASNLSSDMDSSPFQSPSFTKIQDSNSLPARKPFQNLVSTLTKPNRFASQRVQFKLPSPVPENPLTVSITNSTQSTDYCISSSSHPGPHKQNAEGCLPLDFLADPDPWATIGEILGLEPPPDTLKLSRPLKDGSYPFTFVPPIAVNRRGVGHGQVTNPSPPPEQQVEIVDEPCLSNPAHSDKLSAERHVPCLSEPESMDTDEHIPSSDPLLASGLHQDSPREAGFIHRLKQQHEARHLIETSTFPPSFRVQPVDTTSPYRPTSHNPAPKSRSDVEMTAANTVECVPEKIVIYHGPCLFSESEGDDDE